MAQSGANKKETVRFKDATDATLISKLRRAWSFSSNRPDSEKQGLKYSASVSNKSQTDNIKQNEVTQKSTNRPKIKERSFSTPECIPERPHSYNMTHKNRGLALIFNHKHFQNISTRIGTEKDSSAISEVLHDLEFEVRKFENLTLETIIRTLKGVSEEDHYNNDCLVVVVMTHGTDNDCLHSFNFIYDPNLLWKPFKKCETLENKPKLFFIQACRGDKPDNGHKVRTETDARTIYNIPSDMQDLLVMRSSFEGYYSWRDHQTGTWFIQELCKQFKSYDKIKNIDLLTALTFVNRRVALEHITSTKNENDDSTQVCSIMSTLRKLIYFDPKSTI